MIRPEPRTHLTRLERLVAVRRPHGGMRLYLLGYRAHHFTSGFLLALTGLLLMLHDRNDAGKAFKRERLA